MSLYALGIDLGTTNSVLSYTRLDAESPAVEVLPIPQLVSPGTVERRRGLPSFAYIASDPEIASKSLDMPWSDGATMAVGEFARRQSAETPHRTVAAAKSWLCHSRVDRRQPILPWDAPPDVAKLSPVAASQQYLEHLVAAWEAEFPDAPIAQQQVVLAVPASFDAVARELTREAAVAAGLPDDLILLEEPQAAVYAWLADNHEQWRKRLTIGDRLLVCDVGGGTTDLTLIEVREEAGDLILERVAVGEHLLVGGDNMDLALAYSLVGDFASQGTNLDPWQSVALCHSCRNAKETLLSPDGPDEQTISVLGRGSRLIGGTVSVTIAKSRATEMLVDGFFPRCGAEARPEKRLASGFQELGLPYASDTGVTRHLAAFLASHQGDRPEERFPTRILLNGGVFKSAALRDRLESVLSDWAPQEVAPQLLAGTHDLDYAVARGAAYYGWSKQAGGVRIRGGTARSYYVGIETAGLAIPGAPRPLRAVCVVPFGMEEGTEIDVPSAEVGLVLGEPAHFRFFSSPVRQHDQPGTVLQSWSEDELFETDSLEATLPRDESSDLPYVPVRFQSRVTELGVFELWCVSTTSDARWKLEFSVREETER